MGSNLGFDINTEAISNEVAACTSVVKEYNNRLQLGQEDDVDGIIDEFIEKLKANGMDKIVEETQKQLTAWRAANGKTTK